MLACNLGPPLALPSVIDRRWKTEQQEFWLHKPSGEVWAVKKRDGKIIAVAGPITREDAEPELLDYFVYDARDCEWVIKRLEEFIRLP